MSTGLGASVRASLMVKASVVADAASMPLHWIYSQDKVQELIQGLPTSAFYHTPSCPWYKYPVGVCSPYGAEDLPLIASVAKVGALDTDQYAQEFYDYFSSYDKEDGKGYVGRVSHAPKQLLDSRNSGKPWSECSVDDNQAHGIAKAAVIVARYAGSSELSHQLERMVRVLQRNVMSVESTQLVGKLLENVLLTNISPSEALHSLSEDASSLTPYQQNVLAFLHSDERIREWVRFASRLNSQPAPSDDERRNMRVRMKVLSTYLNGKVGRSLKETIESAEYASPSDEQFAKSVFDEEPFTARDITPRVFAAAVGLTCHLPESLVNALYVIKHARTLKEAVEMNNEMAGDNCSRIMAIAPFYGANATSEEALPQEWIDQVRPELWQQIREGADTIVAANPNLN